MSVRLRLLGLSHNQKARLSHLDDINKVSHSAHEGSKGLGGLASNACAVEIVTMPTRFENSITS